MQYTVQMLRTRRLSVSFYFYIQAHVRDFIVSHRVVLPVFFAFVIPLDHYSHLLPVRSLLYEITVVTASATCMSRHRSAIVIPTLIYKL